MGVYCVAISTYGEQLVSVDHKGKVLLWFIADKLSAVIPLHSSCNALFGHRSKVDLGQNLH
jgi:hypothetical protein